MTSSKIRWSLANPWTNNFYTTKVHRDRPEILQLKSHIIFCILWSCKMETFFHSLEIMKSPFHTWCVINRSEKLLQIVTCVQHWMESRTSKALDWIVGATKILSSVNVWKPVSINFSRFCPIIITDPSIPLLQHVAASWMWRCCWLLIRDHALASDIVIRLYFSSITATLLHPLDNLFIHSQQLQFCGRGKTVHFNIFIKH